MKKWLFLIPFFLLSCKKKDNGIPLVNISQYPSVIAIYDVDINTDIAVLRYQINYYYNDSNRFDSIRIAGRTYKFDYSQFSGNSKIKLNYDNLNLPYDVINYDNIFYNLTSYKQIFGVNDTSENTFQYDSINRIKRFEYSYNNSLNDFVITQTYKKDTVFSHKEFPNNACISNDTIKNTTIDMSKTLPYLLFTKPDNSCGIILYQNILSAIPLSSFTNKLPSKIISNNKQVNYSYNYDTNDRVTMVDIAAINRNSNTVISKNRLKILY